MRSAALAAVMALAAASPALAQETPAPAPAPAAPRADPIGVTVADTSEWLKSVGATVQEPAQGGGRTYVSVNDGRLTWTLWFYTCAGDVCDDIQFGAIFTGGLITAEKINEWNRDNRFLKAFYVQATGDVPARAAVQYDVLLTDRGVEQLTDTTATWAEMLDKFANTMGFTGPAQTAPAAAPPAQ